jgi:hypothetical protein
LCQSTSSGAALSPLSGEPKGCEEGAQDRERRGVTGDATCDMRMEDGARTGKARL